MHNLEYSVIRFTLFLGGTAFCNYALFSFISQVLGTKESQLGFFSVLNLGIFCFLFFYGNGGVGKDAPAYLPALCCIVFWIMYCKPKPPKRRRRKVKQIPKKRRPYTGVCGLPPGAPA